MRILTIFCCCGLISSAFASDQPYVMAKEFPACRGYKYADPYLGFTADELTGESALEAMKEVSAHTSKEWIRLNHEDVLEENLSIIEGYTLRVRMEYGGMNARRAKKEFCWWASKSAHHE